MRRLVRLLFVFLFLIGWTGHARAQPPGATVLRLVVQGPITPVVQGYVARGIDRAEAGDAAAVLIEMDTPGGPVNVMEAVVKDIQASSVPVIVYVAPPGATAASAGTFLVLAAHVAAMAPNTSIGAASPVAGGGEELPQTAQAKAQEILSAMARGLAQRRGQRAVEWAEKAVTEAVAATAEEALQLGVVDLVAASRQALLEEVDGREVRVAGEEQVLKLAAARIETVPMNAVERFLHSITDPNVAIILMVLGLNGLIFELANPGAIFPGVVGAVALLLGLYATGVLSVDYTGLIFLALAFALFAADLFAPTHGILTLGGIAALVLGASMLFNTPYADVSTAVVVGLAVASGGFFAFAVGSALRAQRRRTATGREGLVGATAVVRSDLAPRGKVFLHGELWDAVSESESLPQGSRVEVVGVEGFTLRVQPKSKA